MRSTEIRSALRKGPSPGRDTRGIHELARSLARERLHLAVRPARPGAAADVLWSRNGKGYKVTARSVSTPDEATVLEVAVSTGADYLLAVFLEKGSFRLLGMARLPWSTVEWLGKPHGRRLRLAWAESSPARGMAEIL